MKTIGRAMTSLMIPTKSFVSIMADGARLEGELEIPAGATGVVLFVHGSGGSRYSPRDRHVAAVTRDAGIGTLLFDLLTYDEEQADPVTGVVRLDMGLLARRLLGVSLWLADQPETHGLKVGYFGARAGGGAALTAAAELGDGIAAVVTRGGRPDLADDVLPRVKCPTLLIVGGSEDDGIRLNETDYAKLRCEKKLRIVPCAAHLFDGAGPLERVARISAQWFGKHMGVTKNGKGFS